MFKETNMSIPNCGDKSTIKAHKTLINLTSSSADNRNDDYKGRGRRDFDLENSDRPNYSGHNQSRNYPRQKNLLLYPLTIQMREALVILKGMGDKFRWPEKSENPTS